MRNYAFICDDKYALPTAVAIYSLIKSCGSSKGENNIFVCTCELSEAHSALLRSLENSSNHIIIRPIDVSRLRAADIEAKSHVSTAALIKFDLPYLFPELDTLLYLDSDLIVKEDISDLFDCDLSGHALGAVFDFYYYICSFQYGWGKRNRSWYFNSGVMLLNLKKMREDRIPEKLWEARINDPQTAFMDQESFNAVCGSHCLRLPGACNCMVHLLDSAFIGGINDIYHQAYRHPVDLLREAKIIHYARTDCKPWLYSDGLYPRYWLNCYSEMVQRGLVSEKITPVPYATKKMSKAKRMVGILKAHGLSGFLSYCVYRKRDL